MSKSLALYSYIKLCMSDHEHLNNYVTQHDHEKIWLMCAQNLTTFWISSLHNYI